MDLQSKIYSDEIGEEHDKMVEFRNEIRSRQDSEDSDVSFEDMLNHYEAE